MKGFLIFNSFELRSLFPWLKLKHELSVYALMRETIEHFPFSQKNQFKTSKNDASQQPPTIFQDNSLEYLSYEFPDLKQTLKGNTKHMIFPEHLKFQYSQT